MSSELKTCPPQNPLLPSMMMRRQSLPRSFSSKMGLLSHCILFPLCKYEIEIINPRKRAMPKLFLILFDNLLEIIDNIGRSLLNRLLNVLDPSFDESAPDVVRLHPAFFFEPFLIVWRKPDDYQIKQ